MTADTTARIAAIRGRLVAATPGPWSCRDRKSSYSKPNGFVYPAGTRADAALIASAPDDLAWALDELERQQGVFGLMATALQMTADPAVLALGATQAADGQEGA